MASLWEHPETEVEGVHLAIALAYHGLLRVPSRAETSDLTPRKSKSLSRINQFLHRRTVSLPPDGRPALSLSTLIWRYIRQFVKMDAKEALQYVHCITLCADQPAGVGREQVESAWELVRRIIVLANSGTGWEELVGGFRPDGTRFVSCLFTFSNVSKLIVICRAVSLNKARRYSNWTTSKNTTSTFSSVLRSTARRTTGHRRLSSCITLPGTTRRSLLA